MTKETLRWRKFSPIDREYPIYELVNETNTMILDITRTGAGNYEIAFHDAAKGLVVELATFEAHIAEAKRLLSE